MIYLLEMRQNEDVKESLLSFNPYVPKAPFVYPVKTSENRKGVEKGCIGNKWIN